ncbi:MAG: hypothetical protein CME70_14110 [Halobacteriovorax sp.]|nr:hypothetical protein [Halobacteriovorax sp.]|tara:strand:+ start:430 stop:1134 length:705 start_codon:yes stop_codon:yes gene_type:complete
MSLINRDKIVDDLLRRRPLGPKHPYQKVTYEKNVTGSRWCNRKRDHIEQVELIPSVTQWGYTDRQLFDLGFRSEEETMAYVLERFFDGKEKWSLGKKKATATRRTNRLWQRISPAVSNTISEGGVGIYKVRGSYHWTIGYLYATSKEEAKIAAKLYFGYLIKGDKYSTWPRTEFVRFGTVSDVLDLNAETKASIAGDITRAKSRIEDLKKEIETLNIRSSALAMVESQQLEAEL